MGDLTFSINMCDKDGDVFDKCILVHIGENIILRFNNISEYDGFINELSFMRTEINKRIDC